MKIRLVLRQIREKVLELGDLRSHIGGVADPCRAEWITPGEVSLVMIAGTAWHAKEKVDGKVCPP
jgi:hypothetical protein